MSDTIRKARQVVKVIIADLTGRKGLRHEWDNIDDDIQTEIREVWEKVIVDEFAPAALSTPSGFAEGIEAAAKWHEEQIETLKRLRHKGAKLSVYDTEIYFNKCAAKAIRSLSPSGGERPQPVTLGYTNYRGEFAMRTIVPIRIWFGSTEWHPEPQWFLKARDVEKGVERDFALKDFGTSGFDDGIEAAIEKLIGEALGVCEPENADEEATAYTRATLRKRFGPILRSLSPSGERASIVAWLRRLAADRPRGNIPVSDAYEAVANSLERCDDQPSDHTAGGG